RLRRPLTSTLFPYTTLFRSAHDRAGDDGDARAQRRADETAAAEALQLVALAERLADALVALGEHADELALPQQPRRVGLAGEGVPRLAGQVAEDRDLVDEVRAEQADLPSHVVVHRDRQHERVEGDRPGVVG